MLSLWSFLILIIVYSLIFRVPDVGNTAGGPVSNEAHQDQVNVVPKKKSAQSWYSRLTPEEKAEHLMKLRMSRLQKKAAQPCTPSSILPGNKYCGLFSFRVHVDVMTRVST